MMSIYQAWRKIRGDRPPPSDDPASTRPMPVVQEALDKTDIAAAELTDAIKRTMDAFLERTRQ